MNYKAEINGFNGHSIDDLDYTLQRMGYLIDDKIVRSDYINFINELSDEEAKEIHLNLVINVDERKSYEIAQSHGIGCYCNNCCR